jgi:zinc transport system substrate-binding protein
MITILMKRGIAVSVLACTMLAACSSGGGGDRGAMKVVAAFYPLAWAAQRIAPGADVEDLTPAGGEPHDLQLTARQRSDVESARVVFLLGRGFQPELEKAVKDAHGRIVDLLEGVTLLPSTEDGLAADPHAWLDPSVMQQIILTMAATLIDVDPAGRDGYGKRGSELAHDLNLLDVVYRSGLGSCTLKTLVTTHEAFGYLAKRYGLTQLGLTGLTPEAEPSAAQIQHVRELARRGQVGAIFYEDTDEGRRIGRSVASDVGVPAVALHTLESDPALLDYLSQMRKNLTQLRRGLRCR